ncbi:MAG: hypothetical protein GIKADHBN_03006 [Phycisphaerales bacterium]|nr:hypothetical protein [Phycisphaerales bacterium]
MGHLQRADDAAERARFGQPARGGIAGDRGTQVHEQDRPAIGLEHRLEAVGRRLLECVDSHPAAARVHGVVLAAGRAEGEIDVVLAVPGSQVRAHPRAFIADVPIVRPEHGPGAWVLIEDPAHVLGHALVAVGRTLGHVGGHAGPLLDNAGVLDGPVGLCGRGGGGVTIAGSPHVFEDGRRGRERASRRDGSGLAREACATRTDLRDVRIDGVLVSGGRRPARGVGVQQAARCPALKVQVKERRGPRLAVDREFDAVEPSFTAAGHHQAEVDRHGVGRDGHFLLDIRPLGVAVEPAALHVVEVRRRSVDTQPQPREPLDRQGSGLDPPRQLKGLVVELVDGERPGHAAEAAGFVRVVSADRLKRRLVGRGVLGVVGLEEFPHDAQRDGLRLHVIAGELDAAIGAGLLLTPVVAAHPFDHVADFFGIPRPEIHAADQLVHVAVGLAQHVRVELVRLGHVGLDREDREAELLDEILEDAVLGLEVLARAVRALAERDDPGVPHHRPERRKVMEAVAGLDGLEFVRVGGEPGRLLGREVRGRRFGEGRDGRRHKCCKEGRAEAMRVDHRPPIDRHLVTSVPRAAPTVQPRES